MFRNFFERTLLFIREWIDNMLTPNDIKQALQVETILSSDMTTAMDTWAKMYVNKADWLNEDPIKPVKSLELPSAVASEIARLVTLEMKLEISGSGRGEFLAEQLDPLLSDVKQILEVGGAKGGVIFKPYPQGKEMPIDIIYADSFYPIKFNSSRRMTSCVFRDTIKRGQFYYTRLELHEMGTFPDANGNPTSGCRITNRAFKSTSESSLGSPVALKDVEEWADLSDTGIVKGATRLLIGYFKPPLSNNIDTASPLGVSWYARAVNQIRQADKHWSNLIWEFVSGERAIYVDETAFDKDSDGNPKLPNNRLYRPLQVSTQIGENNKMFEEWSPEFRDAAYRAGLNDILKRIEFNCGLAYGTLSDPAQVEKTATEVINAKQRSASTIVDNQKALKDALDDLLYSMDIWTDAAKMQPKGRWEASYSFDDSIVVDYQAQFQQDSLSLGQKTMSRVEFRIRNYGESEAVAKKKIAEIDEESRANMDLFGLTQTEDEGANV